MFKFMKGLPLLALIVAACDIGPVAERPFEKKGDPEGETSMLRAADFAGYDGKRLRNSGAALIDANRKRNQTIERTLQGNQ